MLVEDLLILKGVKNVSTKKKKKKNDSEEVTRQSLSSTL